MSQIAIVLYERRLALALARGEPFNDPPLEARPQGPLLTIAETLRRRRQELQQQRQSLELEPFAAIASDIEPHFCGEPMVRIRR